MESDERIIDFVDHIERELGDAPVTPSSLSTERRLLRTITKRCGARVTASFLSRLNARLQEKGINTSPSLDATGLRGDDWIYFAKGPFPPDAMLFPRERDLVAFVHACIGTGVFRDLRPYHEGRHDRSREFRLASNRRIDLLCEERTTSGRGALVALEFKQAGEHGVVAQLIQYLDELQLQFPYRAVRGIILTGREQKEGAALLKAFSRHRIDWYLYEVGFRKVAP